MPPSSVLRRLVRPPLAPPDAEPDVGPRSPGYSPNAVECLLESTGFLNSFMESGGRPVCGLSRPGGCGRPTGCSSVDVDPASEASSSWWGSEPLEALFGPGSVGAAMRSPDAAVSLCGTV